MKRIITFILFLFISIVIYFNSNNSYAYTGNGFIWNMQEITIPLNSNFESYIDNFEVRFYYNGAMTNEDVKVELDSFYYGSLTISTDTVCDKEVSLIAYVEGYSNFDRKTIIVHVKDDEAPVIKCIRDLSFELKDVIENGLPFDKYFSISDNASIDTSTVLITYDPNDITKLGTHEVIASCSDINGNLAKRQFYYTIYNNDPPTVNVASHIEVEYNDLTFNIKDYIEAYDYLDGDIAQTAEITGLDVMTLGTQNIVITVTNSQGNSTVIEKEITVVDLTAPTLELTTYHDTVLKDNAYDIDFYSYINKIYDNACTLTEEDVSIDTSDFTYNIGQNSVYYILKDSSGNYTKRELVIDIRYDIAPSIDVDESKLYFKENESFDLSDYITVSSPYDNNVSSNYKIDEKVLNRSEAGVYEVIVEAMDYAGNETIKKLYVTIESDDSEGLGNTMNNIYKFIYKYKLLFVVSIIAFFTWLIFFINKKRKKLGE